MFVVGIKGSIGSYIAENSRQDVDGSDLADSNKPGKNSGFIVWSAGVTSVLSCELNAKLAWKRNIYDLCVWIKCAKSLDIPFVLLSSYVAQNPCNTYAKHKLLQESILEQASIPQVIIRLPNVVTVAKSKELRLFDYCCTENTVTLAKKSTKFPVRNFVCASEIVNLLNQIDFNKAPDQRFSLSGDTVSTADFVSSFSKATGKKIKVCNGILNPAEPVSLEPENFGVKIESRLNLKEVLNTHYEKYLAR
jgi:hypothetical protein